MSNSDAILLRRVSFVGISRNLATRISRSEVAFTGLVYDEGYVAAESLVALHALQSDRAEIHVRDIRRGVIGSSFSGGGENIPSLEQKITSFLDEHETKTDDGQVSQTYEAFEKVAKKPSQVLEL